MLLQSRLDEKRWADPMECYRLGKQLHTKGDLENHFVGESFFFLDRRLSIILFLRKIKRGSTSSARRSVGTHVSTRSRIVKPQLRSHEDHIAVKEFNSVNHYHPVHKLLPIFQTMTIPDTKAAVEQARTMPAWQMTKVKSKQETTEKAQKEEGLSTLLHLWTCATLRTRSWTSSSKNTKVV